MLKPGSDHVVLGMEIISLENSWSFSEMRSSFVRAKDMDDAKWNDDCVGVCWSYKENPKCSTNATGAASSFVKGAKGDEQCQLSPWGETGREKAWCPFPRRKKNAFPWWMRLQAFHWKGWCGNHLWRLKEVSDLFILFPFLCASKLLCLKKEEEGDFSQVIKKR